ncbi:MAG: hypothetical protein DRH70_07280 [Candidatus Coatesbacteria bacterium]|nr:MAG: hypothetical protein DRH70_07280 [Candidatus Coatesbacteria bacterium]
MSFGNQSRRGSAFAGPLLFLFLLLLFLPGCQNEADRRQEAYDSLKACVNAYWQARVSGKIWQKDTDTCCPSIEVKGQDGKLERRDPVAPQISIERFEIRQLHLNRDQKRAEVKVWLEYSIPLIPTSLTNVVTERWERRDRAWHRVRSNLNGILVGAGRAE